jgi:phytoene dehydrogenase-like protein
MAFDKARHLTAVVIGAGQNGLAAAAALAARGARVTVVEKGVGPGGLMTGSGTGELGLFVRGLHPAALAEFGVEARDLGLGPALPTVALAPDGRHVVIEGDRARFADGRPHPDAAAYRALRWRIARFAAVFERLAVEAPPRLGEPMATRAGLPDLLGLARTGLAFRRMRREERREMLRVLLSNVADLVLDEMADGPLAAALAIDGVLGCRAGPRAPGTVLTLLWRHLQGAEHHRPDGGMAGLAARLAAAAEARGAAIRYGAGAARLTVEGDRVAGVVLEDGETIGANIVLSSMGALPTLRLAGPRHFDAEACRRVRQVRAEGTAARLDLALTAMPQIGGLDAGLHGARLLLAPSVDALEAAYDPVKYDEIPGEPFAEMRIEPAADGARLSAVVQHLPRVPHAGWGAPAREGVVKGIAARLDALAPGLAASITGVTLTTPDAIEAATGAPGGHWHHAEFAADQLLTLRPANGMARYAMGLPGLFLCGAGAHPGGDVTGLPGRNAALAAVAEMAR